MGDAIETAVEVVSSKTGAKPRSRVEIVVPPYTFDHDSTKDLLELSRRDLRRLTSIAARITGNDLAVTIRAVRSSPAMTLEVDGSDRTVVDGLTTQISRVLDRGKPFVPWADNDVARVLGLGIGVALAIGFGSLFSHRHVVGGHTKHDVETWAVFGAIAIAIGVTFLIQWVVPNLEVLPPDGVSRLRRARRAVVAVVGFGAAVLTIVVALH